MPVPRAFRPEDFAPEVELLEEPPGRWAIVGGMAAIIWAERYLGTQEHGVGGLDEPLTSKDLDVRGCPNPLMLSYAPGGRHIAFDVVPTPRAAADSRS